jgi:chromosome segregation ATPase
MTEPDKKANLNQIIIEVKEIHEGLKKTLANLRDRISLLETDRAGLLLEIERLKNAAESRAGTLEIEIGQLRQEINDLKDILGAPE